MTPTLVPPKTEITKQARIASMEEYQRLYRQSLDEPETFWRNESRSLTWFHEPTSILDVDLEEIDFSWFAGGRLNVAINCVDRHAAARPDKPAIVWVKNEPGATETITYRQLRHRVGRMANALLASGVKKGDRVVLYMPMMPELVVTMLACARIGAVHSVVFGGFSAEALRDRILDAGAKVVVTADELVRGTKRTPLKHTVDQAVDGLSQVERVFVAQRTGAKVPMRPGRDVFLDEETAKHRSTCPAEWMASEDPLFILYTSGSTGKPKGVLHTTAGYLLYASLTYRTVFDAREDDVHMCTADLGWITGHSYVVYGPLAHGATTVLFEPVPTHPDPGRLWEAVDQVKATALYTSPTALRALMREGNAWVEKSSRATLRTLAVAGEPINPEVWWWFHDVVGEGRCAVLDTWWHTETGGILISPLPGATPCKPGSATLPFFGIDPVLVDEDGRLVADRGTDTQGNLCIARPWPGQARTIHSDHRRFRETYFSRFPSLYFTGDGCRRDADGYHWITGRVDDVLNVSGHRIGTAELENALTAHDAVAEAGVVGIPHDVKGEGICAYVILKPGAEADYADEEQLKGALKEQVRHIIGPVASPDEIRVVPVLPKTRSGKVMRRVLRKIAAGQTSDFGDLSTLADPAAVDILVNLPVESTLTYG